LLLTTPPRTLLFFLFLIRPPPTSTLFPYTTLFRSAVQLETIEQPTLEFDTFGDVFERALEQEERVTAQINDLYELAFRSKAFAEDRKSTRLNSSHVAISYAVFCLKKKKKKKKTYNK